MLFFVPLFVFGQEEDIKSVKYEFSFDDDYVYVKYLDSYGKNAVEAYLNSNLENKEDKFKEELLNLALGPMKNSIHPIDVNLTVDSSNDLEIALTFQYKRNGDFTYEFEDAFKYYTVTLIGPPFEAIYPPYDHRQGLNYEFLLYSSSLTIDAYDNIGDVGIISDEYLLPLANLFSKIKGVKYIEYDSMDDVDLDSRRYYAIGIMENLPEEVIHLKDISVSSAALARIFLLYSDEIALTYFGMKNTVEQGVEYALENNVPLLFISTNNIPQYVQETLKYMGVKKLTLIDPYNLVKPHIKESINGLPQNEIITVKSSNMDEDSLEKHGFPEIFGFIIVFSLFSLAGYFIWNHFRD